MRRSMVEFIPVRGSSSPATPVFTSLGVSMTLVMVAVLMAGVFVVVSVAVVAAGLDGALNTMALFLSGVGALNSLSASAPS
jgi:hypothetical protein